MVLIGLLVLFPAERPKVDAPPPPALVAASSAVATPPPGPAETPAPPPSPAAPPSSAAAPSEPRAHVEARAALGRLREGMRGCILHSLVSVPGSSPRVPAHLEQTAGAGYLSALADWKTPIWSCARFRIAAPMGFQLQWQMLRPAAEGRGIAWTDDDGDGRADYAVAFHVSFKPPGGLELGEIEPIDPSTPPVLLPTQ